MVALAAWTPSTDEDRLSEPQSTRTRLAFNGLASVLSRARKTLLIQRGRRKLTGSVKRASRADRHTRKKVV
uniref:WGS project CBMI000000000 data, contig CS3069_c001206 n=1 Tax=Fusarium clavum TaxID=2594811 RepID=A0A090MBE7_9HYPO|nr:unnamed protein product [Fusarium clavum]